MRTWIELPEALIDQIDAVGTQASPFEFQFNGARRTRSLKLYSLLTHALQNPPDEAPKPTTDETPTTTPIIPTTDGEPLDWETLGTAALTRKAIDRMETADLLAYIIGETSIGNAVDLKNLAGCSVSHLMRRFDLCLEDANRLAMLFEFARRVAQSHSDREKVTAPCDVADYLMPMMRYLQHEVLVVLALDTKGGISDALMLAEDANTAESAMGDLIGHRRLFEGTLNACVFHPREIFRYAIDCNANSIIIAHNHPSGDPQPSQEDIRATKQLIEAGNPIGINVLDHVIIGDGIFVSLKEEGFI